MNGPTHRAELALPFIVKLCKETILREPETHLHIERDRFGGTNVFLLGKDGVRICRREKA